MKLLIVTQRVDRSDPVLGFFHRWIEEFARQCEQVIVITQQEGQHELPANAGVISLGKEKQMSTLTQILFFFMAIRAERANYDAVFVHMTPIWVVIGWPLWALMRKPVFLWYEARGARWPLRVSLHIVRAVFSASTHGLPVASPKSIVTGHGIDTQVFIPGTAPRDHTMMLTVGRITASKRPHLLIECLERLSSQYHLRMVGSPITDADRDLLEELEEMIREKGLKDRVEIGPLPNNQIIPLLQKAGVFLHASETSLDKAVLEAMSCGCPVVSCAEAAKSVLPALCKADPHTMASVAQTVLSLPEQEKITMQKQLRSIVEEQHSLPTLVRRLCSVMSESVHL